MFEDFSFVSSATTISPDPHYALSSYIDPLDSLSPLSQETSSPSSAYFPCANSSRSRDIRFHASRTPSMDSVTSSSRRPSIDTLTNQFNSHAPFESINDSQPRSAPIEEDEGFDEPASNHFYAAPADCRGSIAPLSAFDYSISTLASSPNPSSRPLGFAARRRQRQLLTRLQCLASGKMESHLTILMEECHPSSLPFSDSDSEKSPSTGSSRKPSITSVGCVGMGPGSLASRPERTGAIVKRAPRFRRRKT